MIDLPGNTKGSLDGAYAPIPDDVIDRAVTFIRRHALDEADAELLLEIIDPLSLGGAV